MSEATDVAIQQPARPPMRLRRTLGRSMPKEQHFLRLFPVILLTLGLLMPAEVRLNIAGQTLYAYRIVWVLLSPWVLAKLMSGSVQFRFNDALVGFATIWMVLSFVVNYGWVDGLPSGVALGLDVLIPYLIARLTIRNLDDLRRYLIVIAPIMLLLAILLPVEGVLHNRFIRNGAAAIFGSLSAAEFGTTMAPLIASDARWGLLRAMGPFSHPILAGLFFCTLLPLYFFSRLRGWPMFAGVFAGMAAVFTLSSAAMIGLFLGIGLAAYDKLRRIVAMLNWPIFIGFGAMALTGLHIASQNGLLAVLIRFTFNPQTGYYRQLIWEYGSQSVARNPFFGIGFEKFQGLLWMGDSIDAFWLALAVRHGLIPSVLLFAATVLVIVRLSLRASATHTDDNSTYVGLAITMLILLVLGFTVSFFGGLLTWFAVMLGFFTTLSANSPNHIAVRRKVEMRRPA